MADAGLTGGSMLEAITAPFRTARSLGRMALMALVMYIPFVGGLVLNGWLLDHQRDIAWGAGGEMPGVDFSGERITTGLWALVISWVWMMPVSLIASVIGTGVMMVRLMGPLSAEVSQASTSAVVDPIVAQERMMASMTEVVMPAVLWMLVIVYLAALLAYPFIHAALTRYNLYRAPREGFRLGAVWSTLKDGGSLSAAAMGLSIGTQFVAMLPVLIAWPFLMRSFVIVGPSVDPGAVASAIGSYLVFMLVSGTAAVIAVPLQVVAYSGWGAWARRAYRLDEMRQGA